MARIVLDLTAESGRSDVPTPVAGSLTTESGQVNHFVGWTELLVLLEKSISDPAENQRPE